MPAPAPILPPPSVALGPLGWVRRHLCSTWYDTLVTLALLALVMLLLPPLWQWVSTTAHWQAVSRNLRLFTVGLYPGTLLWRPGVVLLLVAFLWGGSTAAQRSLLGGTSLGLCAILVALAVLLSEARLYVALAAVAVLLGYSLCQTYPQCQRYWPYAWGLSLPVVFVVLGGGAGTGLTPVSTTQWGGLLLTLLIAAVGIVASLPLGIILALGRQSTLPIMRWCAVAYIELVRGVPLVSVLMMFALLLPLFIPTAWGRPDTLLRILIGMTLFTAAYVAENVRGGLQAIPRGQYEAATALGLTWVQTMRAIILPQALRAVIPALVGQCISLFKDTSLATIIGSLELLGIAKTVIEQGEWKSITGGVVFEVFTYTALVYAVFTSTMSRLSRRLERALGVGIR